MSTTSKLVIFLFVSVFLVCRAHAQIAITPTPDSVPVCIEKRDAYALALADMQGTLAKKWHVFVTEGRCRYLPATYLYTIDTYKDDTNQSSRVVELTAFGERVWGIRGSTPAPGVWQIRDDGQWEKTDPITKQWYRDLMQPDNPMVSCCGEADAYYADKVVTRGGKNYAVITDDRDDILLGRPHIPMGTEILIPNHKYKWSDGNPTGHRVIFVNTTLDVYCFVDGAGI